MGIVKFHFGLDPRTGTLVGGGLQIILGPMFYIYGLSSMFQGNLLAGNSICFVYSLICLVAGLLLICGSFLHKPSYVLIHQITSAIGAVLLLVYFVMVSKAVHKNPPSDGPEYELGMMGIIALLGLLVCIILQIYLIIGSAIFYRKLKTGEIKSGI